MKTILALSTLAASTILASAAAHARPMTPEDLVKMKRLGGVSVSAEEDAVLYSVSAANADMASRTTTHMLHSLETGSAEAVPELAEYKARSARFGGDNAIWFVSSKSGNDQLYRLTATGEVQQMTSLQGGSIDDFVLAPNAASAVLVATRDLRCVDFECANVPAAPKSAANVQTYDEIFVRQWDTWVEQGVKSRIFGYRLQGDKLVGGQPLDKGLTGNTPSRPFGGTEEIAIAPGGEAVYFAQRMGGASEPTSTNLDIYYSPIDGVVAPYNLTSNNPAHDNMPTISPDGQTMAYVAMARPGYESDRFVLNLRNLATGEVRALTQDWDASIGSIAWTPDSSGLIVGIGEVMEHPIYRVDAATGARTRLTDTGNAGNAIPLSNGGIIHTSNSILEPTDLYLKQGDATVRLTDLNRAVLNELDPMEFEKFSFAGANGDTVWGFRLKPADAESDLPIAFVVHGGPQGSFGNGWSTRWNPRTLSGSRYAVVSIDFHGSTGYGQAFTDSINKDWGGKPLEDLKLGLAHALEMDDQLDGERICALGASYGGYMMNWIQGHWSDRFSCIINHAGLFDMRSFYYVTEELWFPRWDLGGRYADAKDTYEKWNPVNYVDNWKTPMLVIHGLKDFRVPYGQGLGAFTALQERGIPSRLVVFPDENHWILNGANSLEWHREVHGWMDRWTAEEGPDRSLDTMQ
ncbi:S9 family peptidase [Sphingomicrobium flavum]|uniref:S9 family peptidase n=1 Tax=Sphingomicrobium flavum TaxID=1229164 RepID=UPI0021AD59EF|nr:S9 family peptidase [Sphingomicrobium flavum]